MNFRIPHNRPFIGDAEAMAMKKVLASGWLVAGDEVRALEQSLGTYVKKQYAVAVNSGLSALHLALLGLGVGKGDEVIIPSYTCMALLHAIHYVGAAPVVVDIEADGFGIDPERVRASIGDHTKALIVPHTFGLPAALEPLKALGLPIVEDCAIALGTTVGGKPLGSFGEVSIFSFYATKMITSGQGGMLATDDEYVYQEVQDRLTHSRRKEYKVAYNYRLTDIAAAMVNIQFGRLGAFVTKRQKIARQYSELLQASSDYKTVHISKYCDYNHYRFIVQAVSKAKRDYLLASLRNRGIEAIIPIQPYEVLHRLLDLNPIEYPHTEQALKTTLSLPLYPSLSKEHISHLSQALEDIV